MGNVIHCPLSTVYHGQCGTLSTVHSVPWAMWYTVHCPQCTMGNVIYCPLSRAYHGQCGTLPNVKDGQPWSLSLSLRLENDHSWPSLSWDISLNLNTQPVSCFIFAIISEGVMNSMERIVLFTCLNLPVVQAPSGLIFLGQSVCTISILINITKAIPKKVVSISVLTGSVFVVPLPSQRCQDWIL